MLTVTYRDIWTFLVVITLYKTEVLTDYPLYLLNAVLLPVCMTMKCEVVAVMSDLYLMQCKLLEEQ